jgi:hypothetical protein
MKKSFLFPVLAILVLFAACSNPSGGSSGSSGSSGTGTSSSASGTVNGTSLSARPYSYWEDGTAANNFDCWAESTEDERLRDRRMHRREILDLPLAGKDAPSRRATSGLSDAARGIHNVGSRQ